MFKNYIMNQENRSKNNIKDNRVRINKLLNNSNKIKNISFLWKASCTIGGVENITYTNLKCKILIEKINNKIILEIKPNIIGFKNYGEVGSLDIISSIEFNGYKLVDSTYNYGIIPAKYCPKEDIDIIRSPDPHNLNNGLMCYKLSTETFGGNTINLVVPNNISLRITTDGKIKIYNCSFISNKNQNIYLNNFTILYNLNAGDDDVNIQ